MHSAEPSPLVHEPLGQSSQVADPAWAENVPWGHREQGSRREDEKLPAGQTGWQSVGEVEPRPFVKSPGGQLTQIVAPVSNSE